MNSHAVGDQRNIGGRHRLWVLPAVAGGVLQLTVGFYTIAAIGLVSVPVWAIIVLAGVWLAAAVLFVRTVRHAPFMAALVPVANGLLLWGAIAAGGAWLGWTA